MLIISRVSKKERRTEREDIGRTTRWPERKRAKAKSHIPQVAFSLHKHTFTLTMSRWYLACYSAARVTHGESRRGKTLGYRPGNADRPVANLSPIIPHHLSFVSKHTLREIRVNLSPLRKCCLKQKIEGNHLCSRMIRDVNESFTTVIGFLFN